MEKNILIRRGLYWSGAIGLLAIVSTIFYTHLSDQMRLRSEIGSIQTVINRGEQGWADTANEQLQTLESSTQDKELLAGLLVSSRDGSLCAEGILMQDRINSIELTTSLKTHVSDNRWTWHLESVGDICKSILNRRQTTQPVTE